MPNNTINASIDYLKLQGARKVTKDGKDYVLIDIAASRAKPFKRNDGSESVYGSFDIKSNKNGEDKHGKTHFVAEATTKEERQNKVLLPIIGNAKEFVFGNSGGQRQPSQHGAVPAKQHPLMQDGPSQEEGDDIPF